VCYQSFHHHYSFVLNHCRQKFDDKVGHYDIHHTQHLLWLCVSKQRYLRLNESYFTTSWSVQRNSNFFVKHWFFCVTAKLSFKWPLTCIEIEKYKSRFFCWQLLAALKNNDNNYDDKQCMIQVEMAILTPISLLIVPSSFCVAILFAHSFLASDNQANFIYKSQEVGITHCVYSQRKMASWKGFTSIRKA